LLHWTCCSHGQLHSSTESIVLSYEWKYQLWFLVFIHIHYICRHVSYASIISAIIGSEKHWDDSRIIGWVLGILGTKFTSFSQQSLNILPKQCKYKTVKKKNTLIEQSATPGLQIHNSSSYCHILVEEHNM